MSNTISLQQNKEIYTGIDLFKFIGCLLIATIHCGMYTKGISILSEVMTYATVHFFFVASGFFFSRSMLRAEDSKKKFIAYESRLIKMYLIWALISLPVVAKIYWDKYGTSVFKFAFALARNVFFVGSYTYWYMLALIYAVLFLYLFAFVLKKEKILFVISFLLLILGLLYTYFNNSLSEIGVFKKLFNIIHFLWSSDRNFALRGLFFVCVGYCFAKYKFKPNKVIASIGFVFFTVLRIIETEVIFRVTTIDFLKQNELFLSIIFQGIFMFYLAYSLNINISKKTSLFLRSYSTTVFYTHMFVLALIDNNLEKGFVFDFAVSMAICTAFYFIIRLINNKRLNILINL